MFLTSLNSGSVQHDSSSDLVFLETRSAFASVFRGRHDRLHAVVVLTKPCAKTRRRSARCSRNRSSSGKRANTPRAVCSTQLSATVRHQT